MSKQYLEASLLSTFKVFDFLIWGFNQRKKQLAPNINRFYLFILKAQYQIDEIFFCNMIYISFYREKYSL